MSLTVQLLAENNGCEQARHFFDEADLPDTEEALSQILGTEGQGSNAPLLDGGGKVDHLHVAGRLFLNSRRFVRLLLGLSLDVLYDEATTSSDHVVTDLDVLSDRSLARILKALVGSCSVVSEQARELFVAVLRERKGVGSWPTRARTIELGSSASLDELLLHGIAFEMDDQIRMRRL